MAQIYTDFMYLLNIQGEDLTGAPVEKSASGKSRWAHLSGLVFTPNY